MKVLGSKFSRSPGLGQNGWKKEPQACRRNVCLAEYMRTLHFIYRESLLVKTNDDTLNWESAEDAGGVRYPGIFRNYVYILFEGFAGGLMISYNTLY